MVPLPQEMTRLRKLEHTFPTKTITSFWSCHRSLSSAFRPFFWYRTYASCSSSGYFTLLHTHNLRSQYTFFTKKVILDLDSMQPHKETKQQRGRRRLHEDRNHLSRWPVYSAKLHPIVSLPTKKHHFGGIPTKMFVTSCCLRSPTI